MSADWVVLPRAIMFTCTFSIYLAIYIMHWLSRNMNILVALTTSNARNNIEAKYFRHSISSLFTYHMDAHDWYMQERVYLSFLVGLCFSKNEIRSIHSFHLSPSMMKMRKHIWVWRKPFVMLTIKVAIIHSFMLAITIDHNMALVIFTRSSITVT